MTTGWTIFMFFLCGYCFVASVLVLLLAFTSGFWRKKADEFEAQLIITEKSLEISRDLERRH